MFWTKCVQLEDQWRGLIKPRLASNSTCSTWSANYYMWKSSDKTPKWWKISELLVLFLSLKRLNTLLYQTLKKNCVSFQILDLKQVDVVYFNYSMIWFRMETLITHLLHYQCNDLHQFVTKLHQCSINFSQCGFSLKIIRNLPFSDSPKLAEMASFCRNRSECSSPSSWSWVRVFSSSSTSLCSRASFFCSSSSRATFSAA